MSTKINFSQQIVAISAAFSFDDMSTLQTMLEGTAIEALEKDDHEALKNIKSIAEKFGIEIDLDFDTPVKVSAAGIISQPAPVSLYGSESLAKLEDGESSPDGSTEAEMNEGREG